MTAVLGAPAMSSGRDRDHRFGAARRARASAVVAGMALALAAPTTTAAQAQPAKHWVVGHSQAPAPTPAPTSAPSVANLLVGTQGTFDSGIGSWRGQGAQVAPTANSQAGAGALALTAQASASNAGAWASSGSGPSTWVAATGGNRYELSLWSEAATISRQSQVVEIFYDASGSQLGAVFGPVHWTTVGSWSKPLPTEALAPAGTAYVGAAVVVWGAAGGEITDVDTAVLTTSGQSGGNVTGPLRTSGNRLLDGAGRPLVLRGVQWTGMAADGAPLTDAVAAQMKGWGANLVRVSLGEPYWLSGDCHHDPAYQALVDTAVRAVTSRGMVALLTLMYNDGNTCSGNVAAQPMADSGSPLFWQQVASRYGSNPLVAFDLYNEPHDISDGTWLNGGPVSWYGLSFVSVGMQALYAAVRSTGAANVVVTSANNWANTPPATLVTGTGIVLGAHAYTCPSEAPPNCAAPKPYDPSPILGAFVADSATVPVAVTEWGWPDSGDGRYAQALIGYAEAHGWGWNAYTWNDYPGGDYNLVASQASTYEPTPLGMPVLAGLSANTGSTP